jgi:hypothetical protein
LGLLAVHLEGRSSIVNVGFFLISVASEHGQARIFRESRILQGKLAPHKY